MGDSPSVPDEHPLAEHSVDNLETHGDHLQAYGEMLQDMDPEEVHGVMVTIYTAGYGDTFPSVSEDVDPRMASLWMLGIHIHHLKESAQAAGGSATMETVASDAIEYVRRHGFDD